MVNSFWEICIKSKAPKYRKNTNASSRLTAHVVWVTKYSYHLLIGEVQSRCHESLIQDCESLEIEILKGVVSKGHVHMHIEYLPTYQKAGY